LTLKRCFRSLLLIIPLLLTAAAQAQTAPAPAPAAAPAAAPVNPQALAKAKKVIEILRFQGLPQQIALSLVRQVATSILNANKNKQKVIEAYAKESLVPAVQKRVAALDNQQAVIMASRFSDEELRQILAFYQSPLGVKLLSSGEPIAKDLMKYANETWARQVMSEIGPGIPAELKKRGLVVPPPPK
jgi:uncharacterized protein